jgi:CheY-like chemotaxis protein
LAISQRLVALMGGQLKLESELGRGSTFSFVLDFQVVDGALPPPLVVPAAATLRRNVRDVALEPLPADGMVPTTTSAVPQGRLHGMHILVVDDNLINQQVARELLSKEGAVVTLAGDGQLGVNAVAEASPMFDVVLMDLQMPVMDGYAATRKIRQELGLLALPIIAMTANAMASDRQACLDAGMNEHVGKPFDFSALVALLQRLTQSVPASFNHP